MLKKPGHPFVGAFSEPGGEIVATLLFQLLDFLESLLQPRSIERVQAVSQRLLQNETERPRGLA